MRALIRKEFRQIRRDRRLAISLILPADPATAAVRFCAERHGIEHPAGRGRRQPDAGKPRADRHADREQKLSLAGYYFSVDQLGDAISRDELDAGVVIPYDYARRPAARPNRHRAVSAERDERQHRRHRARLRGGRHADLQRGLAGAGHSCQLHAGRRLATSAAAARCCSSPTYLYNPGLVASWFIVTGVFGLLLILNGSIVASAAMVKERERGTIEQLLMSPAGTYEIIIAKIAPLFVLLVPDGVLRHRRDAGGLSRAVSRSFAAGPFAVRRCASCAASASARSSPPSASPREQAQLTSFFVNPPLSTLSGAFYPIEGMPRMLQRLTVFNPIYHFVVIARASCSRAADLPRSGPIFWRSCCSRSCWCRSACGDSESSSVEPAAEGH